jgi:hypothetical protein
MAGATGGTSGPWRARWRLDANGALTSDGLRDFEYEVWR